MAPLVDTHEQAPTRGRRQLPTLQATILYVDADHDLSDLVRYALARDGFDVLLAPSRQHALRLLRAERIDLVLLDANLPDTTGLELLVTLRSFSRVPVVLLSTRTSDEDVIAGFERGADDYVTKPFSVPVLLQRTKAILHRVRPYRDEHGLVDRCTYRVQGALFRASDHEVVSDGVRIALTSTEGRILALLCQHAGQVFSPARIMECVWGFGYQSDIGVVKTHVRHIRAKLSRLPRRPDPIRTLAGVGYMVPQTAIGEETRRQAAPMSIPA